MNFRDLFQSALALVVFASSYVLIRIALRELPPLTIAAIRFLLASSIMVPLSLTRYRGDRSKTIRIAGSDLPVLLGLSMLQIFIPNVLQNIGLEYTTASVSSVLQSTTPVFTLLLSFLLLKEAVGLREVVGVCMGMAGVVLLSSRGSAAGLAGSAFVGDLLQVGVAFSYAVSAIVGKALLKKYPPMLVVTASFLLSALLLSVCAGLLERNLWPGFVSGEVALAVGLLSFFYCLALVWWYDVLQRTKVFQLYVLLFTMPVLAVLISVVVLNESFTVTDVVFSCVTLVGVAITQIRRQS